MILISWACNAGDVKVWAEQSIGRASTGWDVIRGTTEITDIYLQVVGPADLGREAVESIGTCTTSALDAAYQVYDYTQGDLGKAYGAFKGVFLGCGSLAGIAGALLNRFEIAIARKKSSENGLVVSMSIENPTAAAVDRYVVMNAPKGARALLSALNHIFSPSWSLQSERSGVTKKLSLPPQLVGISLPNLPIPRIIGALRTSGIRAPEIHLPKF
jgi:hypothetical protein